MDLAFEIIGTNGKFQKIIIVGLLLTSFIWNILTISYPLLTLQPVFLCREKNNELSQYITCPKENYCKYDKFDYLIDESKSLNNWTVEFNLYCDRSKLIPLVPSAFFFGSLSGSILLSPIPDKDGRSGIFKKLTFVLLYCFVNYLLGVGMYHLAFIAFVNGVCAFLATLVSSIITEYLDRNIAGIIMSFCNAVYPIGGVIAVCFFYFVNNWRLYFLIITILAMINVAIVYFYFIESARWLNSKNRIKDALDILNQIAIVNGTETQFKNFTQNNNGNNTF